MKQSAKVSCLTGLLFLLSTFSAVASDVAAPAAQATPPSMKNESVKPEVQTDSVMSDGAGGEIPISAQRFVVYVEKPDDYVISIMIDNELFKDKKMSDVITGYICIYNYNTRELFMRINLDSIHIMNTGYEINVYNAGPLITLNIPKKGDYVIIPEIKSKNKQVKSYSFYFSRAVPSKSLWN